MWLLAIESSGKNFSTALFRDGSLVQMIEALPGEAASSHLLPQIQTLLAVARISPRDLSAIAVGVGPGGFTAVRVGLSTAVGLATPFQTPLLGVSTLKAMAMGAPDGLVSSVLPAGRGMIYAGLFQKRGNVLEVLRDERISRPEEWDAKMAVAAPQPKASLIGSLALEENPPPWTPLVLGENRQIKVRYLVEPDLGGASPS